jgi:hypothetical protein
LNNSSVDKQMIKFASMKQLCFFTIAFVLHLLIACTSNVTENTKEFDPSKKKSSEKKVVVVAVPDSLLFWKERYQSDSIKIKFDSISPSFTRHFIDRFNAKSFIKNKLYVENDSVLHFRWSFRDSTTAKNALYNWLDCFGNNCSSIKMYESFKSEKQNSLIFINQKSISFISSKNSLSKDLWMNFEKSVFSKDSMQLLIVQQPGKNALWYRFQKNKFNQIKI